MQTFEERKATIELILTELPLTTGEKFRTLYYWARYERALAQRTNAHRAMLRFGSKIDTNTAVFGLRKQLQDL